MLHKKKKRLFDSFDYESYVIYKVCLLDKITKTQFTERMKVLMDYQVLIPANVCRPVMICALYGYICFIINGHIRYGYIYLMKV